MGANPFKFSLTIKMLQNIMNVSHPNNRFKPDTPKGQYLYKKYSNVTSCTRMGGEQ